MNFDGVVKILGRFDVSDLRDKVLTLDEETWLLDGVRQQRFEVHKQTQSLVLVFCNGWPDVTLELREGWELLKDQAVPLITQIMKKSYGGKGTVIRAMCAKLPPGCEIKLHFDAHASFEASHRIHLPLKTSGDVEFRVDGRRVKMQVGRAYEINNQKPHSVKNHGSEDRIHFIFDLISASPQKTSAAA